MVERAKLGKPPTTPEQRLFSLCRLFGCLPSQLLEEDAVLIQTMLLFSSIERAVEEYDSAVGEDIHKVSEVTMDVIDELKRLGVYEGGQLNDN